jgi:hypothetical protein
MHAPASAKAESVNVTAKAVGKDQQEDRRGPL